MIKFRLQWMSGLALAAALAAPASVTADVPLGTAFTYQGQLKDAGSPATGLFDLDFDLWDAAVGGNLEVNLPPINGVAVIGGLFTVQLDAGANVFDGNARWLQISVNGTPLSPRQRIDPAPYAIQTRGIFVEADGDVGIGTLTPGAQFHVVAVNETPILGESNGIGVFGRHAAASGSFPGVWGETDSLTPSANAVRGIVTSTSPGASSSAVRGINNGTGSNGIGVWGSQDGDGYGVYGTAPNGIGVYGHATAITGVNYGVYGESASPDGWAGYFAGRAYFDDFVGFGTTAPDVRLHVEGGTDTALTGGGFLELGSSDSTNLSLDNNEIMARNNGAVAPLALNADGGNVTVAQSGAGNLGIGLSNPTFQLQLSTNSAAKPTSSTWTISSDRRLKKNIHPIDDALGQLMQLHGVTYQWIHPEDQGNMTGTYTGMIAQDVENVFPEWITTGADGYKRLTVIGFEALAVEAIRDLRAEKDQQLAQRDAQIAALQQEKDAQIVLLQEANQHLQDRLAMLEDAVSRLANQKELR